MPNTVFTTMRANIAGMQRVDPRTYEAMRLMINEMEELFFQVNPLVEAATKVPTLAPPPTPLDLRYSPYTPQFSSIGILQVRTIMN